MAQYCSASYGKKIYCRKCKTYHCQCSWNQCPQSSVSPDKEIKTMKVNEASPSAIPATKSKATCELDAEPAFTPAPWVIEPVFISQHTGPSPLHFGEHRFPFRQAEDGSSKTYPHEEAEANARLMAAAPALYKALQAAVHTLRSYQYGNSETELAEEAANFAEAALLLATKGNEDEK